jgi:acetyl/propionyl-CoA carboxylase alpha subunit
MTAISKAIELSGLDKSKSEILTTKFSSMIEQIEEWKEKANQLIIIDSSQKEEIEQAKQGYKFIKSVRIDIEKTRKSLKEDSLKEGKAIDLIAKSLTDEVSPLESQLEEKAKFVELQEAKIKAKRTQERLEKIASLNYAVPQNSLIVDMEDEMFGIYYNGLVMQAEKAEADRMTKEAKEAKERDALNAPDKEKLKIYVSAMSLFPDPTFSSQEANDLFEQIKKTLRNVLTKASLEIEKL